MPAVYQLQMATVIKLLFVKQPAIIQGEGGYVVMSDGSTVDVARSKKKMLLKKLQPSKH